MMVYVFAEKGDNVVRLGCESSVPAELQEKILPYSQDGYKLDSDSADKWDQQVIKGAQAGMVLDPNLGKSEPAPAGSVEPSSQPSGEAPVPPAAQ